MSRVVTLAVLLIGSVGAAFASQGQPEGLTSQAEKLKSEVLITTLSTEDLTKQVMADNGTIEHKSEVARGGPVAVVVRAQGCEKGRDGSCQVNADIVIYQPDGAVFHQVKNLDLPAGRAAIPFKLDAQSPTGIYRVVVIIRDLTAQRFGKLERQFGVK